MQIALINQKRPKIPKKNSSTIFMQRHFLDQDLVTYFQVAEEEKRFMHVGFHMHQPYLKAFMIVLNPFLPVLERNHLIHHVSMIMLQIIHKGYDLDAIIVLIPC